MIEISTYQQLLAEAYKRATERIDAGTSLDLHEFAPYFHLAPDESTPFHPAVRLDLDKVIVPAAQLNLNAAEARGNKNLAIPVNNALAMNLANDFCREIRKVRFLKRRASGQWPKAKTVVSEGDSWFQYPILLDDVIDVVSEQFNVFSLDAAGDKIGRMRQDGEYLAWIRTYQPAYFLLSGGGNDIVGEGIKEKSLAHHLNPFSAGATAASLLKATLDSDLLARVMGDYDDIIAKALQAGPDDMKILVHGYDYAVPGTGNDWMTRNLKARNILDPQLCWDVVKLIIDRFNTALQQVAARHKRVVYVDVRNKVAPVNCPHATARNEWKDELHPKNPGFRAVADCFLGNM
jgi:metacaspase-1